MATGTIGIILNGATGRICSTFPNPYRIGWEDFLRHVVHDAPLRATPKHAAAARRRDDG